MELGRSHCPASVIATVKTELILSVTDGRWKVIERKPLSLDKVHYEGTDGEKAKEVFDQLISN